MKVLLGAISLAMLSVTHGEPPAKIVLTEEELAEWTGIEGGSRSTAVKTKRPDWEGARRLVSADAFMREMEKKYRKSEGSAVFTNHLLEYGIYLPLPPADGEMHLQSQTKRDLNGDLKITLFVVGYPFPESPDFPTKGKPIIRYFVPKGTEKELLKSGPDKAVVKRMFEAAKKAKWQVNPPHQPPYQVITVE